MSALIAQRDPLIPLQRACAVLGMSRATQYRQRKPKAHAAGLAVRHSPRRLSEAERQAVLDVLHEPRFADQPPAQVWAKMLDEGYYLCSIRTMHRVLAQVGESGERRIQRPKTHHPVPRLCARAPNVVWTWDITKLATWAKAVFLSLYVVLDLFSRYVVAWMVAARENSALAKQLLAEAIGRYGIEPGRLTVHQDRGAPMTARGFVDLLAALGVDPSHSRPGCPMTTPSPSRSSRRSNTSPTSPDVSVTSSMRGPGAPSSSTGTTTSISTRGWRCSRRRTCSTDVWSSSWPPVRRDSTPPTPRIRSASCAVRRERLGRPQWWNSMRCSPRFTHSPRPRFSDMVMASRKTGS
jgi:transposase InsO family protein